jgi:hypothetical protein
MASTQYSVLGESEQAMKLVIVGFGVASDCCFSCALLAQGQLLVFVHSLFLKYQQGNNLCQEP